MKRRPRRVESEVARHLSLFSSQYGLDPIQRVPVLGRTGPDLSLNQLGLVVDVKSRLAVPKSWCPLPAGVAGRCGELAAARLGEIDLLHDLLPPICLRPSATVAAWLAHMDSWTRAHFPQGISALVLHRPGLPVGHATLVIKDEDRRKLYDRYHHHSIPTGLLSCTVQRPDLPGAQPSGCGQG